MPQPMAIVLVMSLIITLLGCGIAPKGEAIRSTFDKGVFENLNANTKFTYSLPNFHQGIYSAVKQFNIVFDQGYYKGENGSVILGKQRESKNWSVIAVFILLEGQWKEISAVLKPASLTGSKSSNNKSLMPIDYHQIAETVVNTEDTFGHGPDVGSAEWQRSVNHQLNTTVDYVQRERVPK